MNKSTSWSESVHENTRNKTFSGRKKKKQIINGKLALFDFIINSKSIKTNLVLH